MSVRVPRHDSVVDLPVTFDRIADFRFVRLLGSGSFAQIFAAVRGVLHLYGHLDDWFHGLGAVVTR